MSLITFLLLALLATAFPLGISGEAEAFSVTFDSAEDDGASHSSRLKQSLI